MSNTSSGGFRGGQGCRDTPQYFPLIVVVMTEAVGLSNYVFCCFLLFSSLKYLYCEDKETYLREDVTYSPAAFHSRKIKQPLRRVRSPP